MMKNVINKLNCAANDTVTLTLAYYDWRLVYTCLVYYEERLDLYNDSKYQGDYYDIINTVESALHGDWDTLNVNAAEDESPRDAYIDGKDVSINCTILESQLIYKAVYNMEDSLYDTGIFNADDNQDCYALRDDFECQLGMTDDDIFNATNVSSNRRGAVKNKDGRTLNSAADMFNEKAFDHYVKSLVEDCVEYASDCGDPVQIIEHMYPGYNWEWACEGTDPVWDKLRKDLQNALYNYIKYSYLAYKK